LPLSTNNLLLAPNFYTIISKLTFNKKTNTIISNQILRQEQCI